MNRPFVTLVIPVFGLIAWSTALYFVLSLENSKACACSVDERRTFIKATAIIMLTSVLLQNSIGLPMIASALIAGLYVSYVFVVFSYQRRLQQQKCDCAMGRLFNFVSVVNHVQIVLISVGVFLLFVAAAREIILSRHRK